MVIPPSRPVVLLGFMGCGKSTLGREMAGLMGWPFTDLDRFIETEEHRTIADLFDKEGETHFRKLEANALARILTYPRQVIAIGGGAPCNDFNHNLLKDKSTTIYLKVSVDELVERLTASGTQRPLLKGTTGNERIKLIGNLLEKRESWYSQSDIVIESDRITANMVLGKLLDYLDQSPVQPV